jgi:hypothetical protein
VGRAAALKGEPAMANEPIRLRGERAIRNFYDAF